MPGRSLDPVSDLWSAIAIDVGGDGRVARPLDVVGLTRPAMHIQSPARETLSARIYLEAPLPYWLIVSWASKLAPSDLPSLFSETLSDGWECVRVWESDGLLADPQEVLREVADRFTDFDPWLGSWQPEAGREDEDPSQRQKYVLGRDLAQSYVRRLAGEDHGASRAEILLEQQSAWSEWIEANAAGGHTPEAICEATSIGIDRNILQDVTSGVNGIGRAHILLEELSVTSNPAMGIMNASILPIDDRHSHLDGILIPDLCELGVLEISPEFLKGVRSTWDYVRAISPRIGPAMLRFSIKPSRSAVLQKLSGRSAEAATLAAIESAAAHRVLRPDAVASASLTLPGEAGVLSDPAVGTASFEDKKFIAAILNRIKTVIVSKDVAEQWNQSSAKIGKSSGPGEPDVVAGEWYRRDVAAVLETRSQWRLAYRLPGAITLAFIAFAALFWQTYKFDKSPIDAEVSDPATRMPLVMPALLGSEMLSLGMSVMMILMCRDSVTRSLDSTRSSWLSLAVCTVIVLLAQFFPIGVRYEGLIDNPFYSVLFGEPQVTASLVIEHGGAGLLILHAVSQSVGFITVLYGVSAFAIRLVQTRAHSEPIYGDRRDLIRNDWYFSLRLLGFFFVVVTIFCLPRNTLWYYYLAHLPGIPLIVNQGSFLAVIGPLIGVNMVLMFSVTIVWLYFLNRYLARVVESARGRSGYTADDVVATLPKLARWLYYARPGD